LGGGPGKHQHSMRQHTMYVYARRVDPSALSFSLPSHRHSHRYKSSLRFHFID
jgi:hypothetical protein